MVEGMFRHSFRTFNDQVKTWEGFEEYSPKIENFMDTFMDKCIKIYEANSHYNVLNHGDHHTKNLLVKKDGDRITDICFVSTSIKLSFLLRITD